MKEHFQTGSMCQSFPECVANNECIVKQLLKNGFEKYLNSHGTDIDSLNTALKLPSCGNLEEARIRVAIYLVYRPN